MTRDAACCVSAHGGRRVKNMLTVVISLANQTLRRSTGLEQFSEVFMRRAHALTAAYALLSRENWSHV